MTSYIFNVYLLSKLCIVNYQVFLLFQYSVSLWNAVYICLNCKKYTANVEVLYLWKTLKVWLMVFQNCHSSPFVY